MTLLGKRNSTTGIKSANNPFSFNNYAFRPAFQPSTSQPFDPADLTRRLELYIASQQPKPNPKASASASGPTQPRHSGLPRLSLPVLKAGTALANSHAASRTASNQNSGPSASPNGRAAADAAVKALIMRLSSDPSSSDGADRQTAERERQEARRAKKLMAAAAQKDKNAPVRATELAMRPSSGAGDEPGSNEDEKKKHRTENGQARRGGAAGGSKRVFMVSSAPPKAAGHSSSTTMAEREMGRRKEKEGGADRVSAPLHLSELRWATIEHEREKARAREMRAARGSMMPPAAGETWKAMAAAQTSTHASGASTWHARASVAVRPRPKSMAAYEQLYYGEAGGEAPRKSKSNGCLRPDGGEEDPVERASMRVATDRPDWSQRDESRAGGQTGLHLRIPGMRRLSAALGGEGADERAMSDRGTGKAKRDVCVAETGKTKRPSSLAVEASIGRARSARSKPTSAKRPLSTSGPPASTPARPAGSRRMTIGPVGARKPLHLTGTTIIDVQTGIAKPAEARVPDALPEHQQRRDRASAPPQSGSASRRTKARAQAAEPAAEWLGPRPHYNAHIQTTISATKAPVPATGRARKLKREGREGKEAGAAKRRGPTTEESRSESEREREAGGTRSSSRLAFWKKDDGGHGGGEANRTPSRLAFWKRAPKRGRAEE